MGAARGHASDSGKHGFEAFGGGACPVSKRHLAWLRAIHDDPALGCSAPAAAPITLTDLELKELKYAYAIAIIPRQWQLFCEDERFREETRAPLPAANSLWSAALVHYAGCLDRASERVSRGLAARRVRPRATWDVLDACLDGYERVCMAREARQLELVDPIRVPRFDDYPRIACHLLSVVERLCQRDLGWPRPLPPARSLQVLASPWFASLLRELMRNEKRSLLTFMMVLEDPDAVRDPGRVVSDDADSWTLDFFRLCDPQSLELELHPDVKAIADARTADLLQSAYADGTAVRLNCPFLYTSAVADVGAWFRHELQRRFATSEDAHFGALRNT